MRTFTTEHTVYTFDELSEDAKKTAIENERQYVYETLDGWLPDEMAYQLDALLKRYKMKSEDAKAFYSLGYSQGDGAMFEGTVEWGAYRVEVRHNGHYYHYNSKQFWNFESIKTGKEVSEKMHDRFNEQYVKLCKELETLGYNAIENSTSDETLARYLEDEKIEFYEDGRSA